MELLNQLRVSVGREPLVRTEEMDAFARNWSSIMHDSGRFEHSSGPYGENIAASWSSRTIPPLDAAERMHQLWVDSPGHLQNMTHSGYTQVGVGFWYGDDGWYATHVFR